MKKRTIWDKKPLKDLDLLRIVREKQEINPLRTKMDIFRELSRVYNKILTPDQFNFRYNYLIRKLKEREKASNRIEATNHKHCSGTSTTNSSYLEGISDYVQPLGVIESIKPQNNYEPFRILVIEFRDGKQQPINMNKALYDMIDPQKLVKFCDKQLQLQKKRGFEGGINIIIKRLAQLFNQNEKTIASRYYSTKRNALKNYTTVKENINKLHDNISDLTNKLFDYEKRFTDLQNYYDDAKEEISQLIRLITERENTLYNLKDRPLVKLSLFIEQLVLRFKKVL